MSHYTFILSIIEVILMLALQWELESHRMCASTWFQPTVTIN